MVKKIIALSFLFCLTLLFISCESNKNEPPQQINNDNVESEITDDNNKIEDNTEKACEHIYKNGKCTICGEMCKHDEWENGICKICRLKCAHNDVEGGYCIYCNYPVYTTCDHDWNNGVCNICGYVCPHELIRDAMCLECDTDFSLDCEHEWVDGVCIKCTLICRHRYENSICTICGYECKHEGLTCGHTCRYCYYEYKHEIVEGKCVICGKRFDYETVIPSKFLAGNCPEQGTVEKVVFQSYDYINNRPYENTFFVYLPYGYKNNTDEYNVFYLTHGSGENAAYWLAQLGYAGGYTEQTKIVLDNMHYYKFCEPTIVVTPTENLNGTKYFYKELVENIMPLAETLYRTKAHLYGKNVNEVDKQAFIDSRMYRAYAGLSRGSMIGYGVMGYDMPYFGYYGYYSGGSYGLTDQLNDLISALNDSNNPYKIYYAYHSCGTNDAMYQNHVEDYQKLLNTKCNKLVEYVNTDFFVKEGFSHNYSAWIVDLYNSLGKRFFKYNDEN